MNEMEALTTQNVCRLCPETGSNQRLLNVFDLKLPQINNMKEVIFQTTGVKICETDLISTKVCERCFNITQKMLRFKQDAFKHDMELKMKCNRILSLKGINIPDTQVVLNHNRSSDSAEEIRNSLPQKDTQSTEQAGLMTPDAVIPNMKPTVLLLNGQVDKYFKERNLDFSKFVYKPKESSKVKQREKTEASKVIERKVTPIKIRKEKKGTFVCSASGSQKRCEQTKEPKVAEKKAKRNLNYKEREAVKPGTLLVSFNTASQINPQISQHLSLPPCNTNLDATKFKQNNIANVCDMGESSQRNSISTASTHLDTQESANILDTLQENGRKSVSSVNDITHNVATETISTLPRQTMAIIKPDVRIKNDTTIDLLPTDLNKKQLIQRILSNIKLTGGQVSVEKMSQTSQPSNKDICVNAADNTYKLQGLKEQLRMFKVPVNVSNGAFHVEFRFKKPRNSEDSHTFLRHIPDGPGGKRGHDTTL